MKKLAGIIVAHVLPPLFFFGLAFWMLNSSLTQSSFGVYITVCFAVGFMIIGSCFLVPYIGRFIGDRIAFSVFLPGRTGPLVPRYSIAQSLVKKGRYEEALSAFEKLSLEFPAELTPHLEMITIAVVNLHDADRAKRLYYKALDLFANRPDQLSQLQRSYQAIASLLDSKPPWAGGKSKISLPPPH